MQMRSHAVELLQMDDTSVIVPLGVQLDGKRRCSQGQVPTSVPLQVRGFLSDLPSICDCYSVRRAGQRLGLTHL